MSRSVVRQVLTLMLILGVPCTHAADGSVVIEAPAEGATLKSKEKNHAVNRGRKGDHVHVYVNAKEVATLHRTKRAYQSILSGAFALPADVPEDFAPFNIQFLEYEIDAIVRHGLFVAYARTTADPVEEEQRPGLGYIAEFDLDGRGSAMAVAGWDDAIVSGTTAAGCGRVVVGPSNLMRR